MRNAGWVAYIDDSRDKLRRTARLVLYRDRADGAMEVALADGNWQMVEPDVEPPHNVGWTVPMDALPAIAEAFHPHAGHKVEVARLEEALKVERARVDILLDRVGRSG